MDRNTRISCFLALTLTALAGCSSQPADQAKKAAAKLDRIQGKAQVLIEQGGATDTALNAGGSSVYLWQGMHRYRLFLMKAADITHGKEYVAEGIYAQKAIEELGDPDQGKNGYPLDASCQRIVTQAWSSLSFDTIDPTASLVRARLKRYPARPLFLVTRIREATSEEISAASPAPTKDTASTTKEIPMVEVPAEKQRALLVEGATTQPAPLWDPKGDTVKCKVVIGTDGKVTELQTGAQLCEYVDWDKFKYQPPVQGGHPVRVSTDVEMQFEARK